MYQTLAWDSSGNSIKCGAFFSRIIATSRIPPWLAYEWGCRVSVFPKN